MIKFLSSSARVILEIQTISLHLYFGAMHLLDLFYHCSYKDFGALHHLKKPQSGEIFVENKLLSK
jgi:hypothetical protein